MERIVTAQRMKIHGLDDENRILCGLEKTEEKPQVKYLSKMNRRHSNTKINQAR
jgi:hypothetical protein